MKNGRRTTFLALIAALGLLGASVARADFQISGGGFGPYGDINSSPSSPPSLSVSFGADNQGSIYQLDGFVNASNYNGGQSADLTNGTPSGLFYYFSASQPTSHQLLLTYSFINVTGGNLNNFQFLSFVDGDIGANFTDETATTTGSTVLGSPFTPSSSQIGDPSSSTLFTNLLAGTLNGANDFPPGTPGDVSVGLGFNVGTLLAGKSAIFQVLLSDDGSSLGNFSVTQNDPIYTLDHLTISGQIVPEPSSMALMAIGGITSLAFAVRRRWIRAQA